MQQVLGYFAMETGLALLPLAGTRVVAAGAAAPLLTRYGVRPVLLAGLVLFAGRMAWFSRLPADGEFVADLLGPSLLVGLGLAATFVALTVASVEGMRPQEYGLASGLINTSQQIGGALGLAVLAAVANARVETVAKQGADAAVALTEGFQSALLVGTGFTVVAVVLAAVLTPRRAPEPHLEPAPARA